jgi:hypothetical protein
MRITIDSDNPSQIGMALMIAKGLYYFKKLPHKIRITERGYHSIFSDIPVDGTNIAKYRMLLGDDLNRIRLDSLESDKPRQILFSEKEVTCNGFIHKNWVKKIGAVNRGICRCHKRVAYSKKTWRKDRKCIEVHHRDGSCCTIRLKARNTFIIHAMSFLGVETE